MPARSASSTACGRASRPGSERGARTQRAIAPAVMSNQSRCVGSEKHPNVAGLSSRLIVSPSRHGRASSRPSTSFLPTFRQGVDARDRHGHDGPAANAWFHCLHVAPDFELRAMHASRRGRGDARPLAPSWALHPSRRALCALLRMRKGRFAAITLPDEEATSRGGVEVTGRAAAGRDLDQRR